MAELPEVFDAMSVPAPHPNLGEPDGGAAPKGQSSVVSGMLGKGAGRKRQPGMPGPGPMTPFATPGRGFAHLIGGLPGDIGSLQTKGYLNSLRQGANADVNSPFTF